MREGRDEENVGLESRYLQSGTRGLSSDISKVFQVDDIFTFPVHISTLAEVEVTHGYLQRGWSDGRPEDWQDTSGPTITAPRG